MNDYSIIHLKLLKLVIIHGFKIVIKVEL
jgi:hypothetical protein